MAFLAAALPGAAGARPVETSQLPRVTEYAPPTGPGAGLLPGLSSGAALNDTVCYGGTAVDGQPDPIPGAVPPVRPFKALRNAVWHFNSGVGSNFTEATQAPKPPGYHHRMEGWTGRDNTYNPLPYFRRSSLCVLNGGFSMYAGVSLLEAQALCYATGQGYGNSWNMTIAKTFNYPGSGTVTFSYRYQTECEPSFDYLYVNIDTTGTGGMDDVNITSYTGDNPAATASHNLVPGITLRSTAGPITLKFNVTSDGGYSDEEGGYPTTCGHSSVDNIQLAGAIVDFSDFEGGTNGWNPVDPGQGTGGEWSDLRALTSLPPPLSFCTCAMADSVLVFNDLAGGHSGGVDNIVGSPWIDLVAGGDVGRPGKLIEFSGYFELPLTNYIFVQALASWYPAVCPNTGFVYTKPPTSDGFVRFFGGVPNCSAPGAPTALEFSGIIPPSAEQVRIFVGVLSYCAMFANCTGVTNSTPWLDDLALCVYGTAGAPIVTQRTLDVFQDNFAADGTLSVISTGRIDTNNVKGASSPQPGTALGDTVIVIGDGGNQEVRVVFHVRPGPFTQAANLANWATAKWTPEPGLGAGWYSARMDTCEQGGTKTTGRWMSTLHEADPKFGAGTDTDRGGEGDVSELSHDIFPDHILTPGSRIDYFVKARHIPPDPRNPGGTNWYVTPDTTGGSYREVEILPSSMAADSSWNCTLYVDHHDDRDVAGQRLEEQGLTAALGVGGHNAEGTKFDRYDVQAPASQQASFGRPLNTKYGASIIQTFAYKVIVWHSSNLASFNLVDEDANNLTSWLTNTEIGNTRFWASGDGVSRSIASEAEPTTINFMNNVCGVRFNCDAIRLATCPTGSVLDSTFCLPLVNVAGAAFTSALPVNARGNGCPNIRSFDLLTANTSITTAHGQLSYSKLDGVKNFASVTNHNTVDLDWETVFDGVSVGSLRDPNGGTHNVALCNVTTPAIARSQDVITWFAALTSLNVCRGPAYIGVPEGPPVTPRPPVATRLAAVYPNPLVQSARIRLTNGQAGQRLRLALFDVTGRLVRQLLDAPLEAGTHEIAWDGRDADGHPVAAGLYFVRLGGAGMSDVRKIIVTR